ncbi:hypothetical protein AMAG_02787 [Allomyces macrogynus ATCC 38327]|uniref:Uncharacterized protein n=1 Tax=Allomyces macrogynus (strain ATCC 38327) TaxID=578462 RepID=A0A0L0S3C0_ALLM3|nr:hypothetical protein AMAG_02787 [Allomyces macrogynus ATCC 38327]|eukprot:KNE57028.1 hypothetical protein AMAG_02787 [Allomyces macrogynus ATCC 38327]
MAKFTKKLVTVLAAILVATITTAHASPVVLQGSKDVTPDVVIQGGDKHVEPSVVLQRRTPVVIQGGKDDAKPEVVIQGDKDVKPDVVIHGLDKKNGTLTNSAAVEVDLEYWNDGGRCSGKGRWSWYCY